MNTITVKEGQSIYDIALSAYGSIDLLFVMMKENGIKNIEEDIKGKKIIQKINANQNMIFVTKAL